MQEGVRREALLVYVQPWLAPGLRQLRIDRVKTGGEQRIGGPHGVPWRPAVYRQVWMAWVATRAEYAPGAPLFITTSSYLGQVHAREPLSPYMVT